MEKISSNFKKILDFSKENDIPAIGYRETARRLGIENPQTVIYYLNKIKSQGWIYYDSKTKKNKAAKLAAFSVDNFFNIPVVGAANCGPALELAQEQIRGYVKISKTSLKRSNPSGLIAIKAVGDSLNRADIHGDSVENGDYVIIDCKKNAPDNGDYVLSVIDGSANLKRFYQDIKKREIRLVSESTHEIPPIVLHDDDIDGSGYLVNGVVLRVIKN